MTAIKRTIAMAELAWDLPGRKRKRTVEPEDEIVLIEHLPGRRVHLQDFFWTGAEDAPPWLDPDQTLTFYETRTVHHTATVYVPVDGQGEGGLDPGCVSCIEPTPTLVDSDQDIGILIGDDPGPRYWLLTVLRAGETVPPKVELRLARLYRAAFARQQQRHLGLFSTDPRLRRAAKRLAASDGHKSIPGESIDNKARSGLKGYPTTQSSSLVIRPSLASNPGKIVGKVMREVKISKETMVIDAKPENESSAGIKSTSQSQTEFESKANDMTEMSPLTTPVMSVIKKNLTRISDLSANDPQPLRSDSENFFPDELTSVNDDIKFTEARNINTKTEQDNLINTTVQNNSMSKQKSIASRITNVQHEKIAATNHSEHNAASSRLRTAGLGMVQVRMQNQTTLEDGATRLIYSVHLGGKPVPAETAAKDMALLSPQEVALELEAPVIIQSEPYLKESRPLALSRRRDAWLLVGATGAALILVTLIIAGLIITAKRKRAHSAVSAPPTQSAQSILKKDRGYTPTTSGLDNTGYTSETEGRTDGTSQRHTPGSFSRTPGTPITPNTLDDEIQELSSDNEEEEEKKHGQEWDIEEYPTLGTKSRAERRRMTRMSAIDTPESPDSMDTVVSPHERRDSLEDDCAHPIEETASPHSYLSMPPCKLFPSMRSVEPLSRILEPVVVKHLDMEFETPEMSRRENGFHRKSVDESLGRTRSALKDPGVVGPIVWDLRRQRAVEENAGLESDTERQPQLSGPVGRARRRLHELLEDSFSLFSTKDNKTKEVSSTLRPSSAAISPDRVTTFVESRRKSTYSSPDESPVCHPAIRPRTSLPRNGLEDPIPETGNAGPPPRGAWGSRPMSAGPFHRPNLPEVNVTRILADSHLPSEDPAVPLIAAIKKELEKFASEKA